MIALMDENKKWGIFSYTSLIEGFEQLGDAYGQKSLHFNAAMAMFLLATEEERELWIQLVERARRARDNRTMLERLRAMAEPTPPAEGAAEQIDSKLKAAAVARLAGPRSAKKAAS